MANILVVDDASFVRMSLKKILTDGGHTVISEAADGGEAIKRYKERRPDLVIMDVTMPEMDGIESLKAIMEFDTSAVVIMCTAMGQQERIVEAITAGAKDFIVKPFQGDRILKSIERALH